MIVYLDLLILDNFCADAALLYCAVRTVKGKVQWWRIALSALLATALGVGYALLQLYYTIPKTADFIIKYTVAFLLPIPAATFQKPKTYALCSAVFLAYTAAFGGILTALCGTDAVGQSGEIVYTLYKIPSGILVGGCILFAFLGVRIAKKLTKHTKVLAQTTECSLVFGKKSIAIRAFVDTGNRLKDRFGNAVAVLQRERALQLFSDFADCPDFEKISVRTINGQSEFFLFYADRLQIYFQGVEHTIENVPVAFGEWTAAGEYGMLLPPEFAKEDCFSGVEVKRC